MVFEKVAANGGVLTMTATVPTAKPKTAQTVFFWFSIIVLGFMLWKVLTMTPRHPIPGQYQSHSG